MRGATRTTTWVRNILRTVCEERLVLTVTRPAAVLAITDLPES